MTKTTTERQQLMGRVRYHLIQALQQGLPLLAFWDDHTNGERLRHLEIMEMEITAAIMMTKGRMVYDNGGEHVPGGSVKSGDTAGGAAGTHR